MVAGDTFFWVNIIFMTKPLTTIKEVELYAMKRIAKLEQEIEMTKAPAPELSESYYTRKLELELLLMVIRGEE